MNRKHATNYVPQKVRPRVRLEVQLDSKDKVQSFNEINDRNHRDISSTLRSSSSKEKLKKGKSSREDLDDDPEKEEDEDYENRSHEVTSDFKSRGTVERKGAFGASKSDVVHHALIPSSTSSSSSFSFSSKKSSSREEDKRHRKTSLDGVPSLASSSSHRESGVNSITSDSNSIFLEEGSQSVMMWCRVSCNPKVTSIHWLFNGKPINSVMNASLSGLANKNNQDALKTEHETPRIHSSDRLRSKWHHHLSSFVFLLQEVSSLLCICILYPFESFLLLSQSKSDTLRLSILITFKSSVSLWRSFHENPFMTFPSWWFPLWSPLLIPPFPERLLLSNRRRLWSPSTLGYKSEGALIVSNRQTKKEEEKLLPLLNPVSMFQCPFSCLPNLRKTLYFHCVSVRHSFCCCHPCFLFHPFCFRFCFHVVLLAWFSISVLYLDSLASSWPHTHNSQLP